MLSPRLWPATEDCAELTRQVRRFVDERIISLGAELAAQPRQAVKFVAELSGEIRSVGPRGSYSPQGLGDRIASLRDYLTVAEQEGRSEYAPAIFGDALVSVAGRQLGDSCSDPGWILISYRWTRERAYERT